VSAKEKIRLGEEHFLQKGSSPTHVVALGSPGRENNQNATEKILKRDKKRGTRGGDGPKRQKAENSFSQRPLFWCNKARDDDATETFPGQLKGRLGGSEKKKYLRKSGES